MPVYPEWPALLSDLVPLPTCDGPKLHPFDFEGPQQIDFLDYVAEGGHSHVLRVRILGTVYAMKVFRFTSNHSWNSPREEHLDDVEAVRAFHNYSEPFNAECRAHGRLIESGHTELSIGCFGYILLDERHEKAMMNQFPTLADGLNDSPETYDQIMGDLSKFKHFRDRYRCQDGRAAPIRCIVKELGQTNQELATRRRAPGGSSFSIVRDIKSLHQLGIMSLDVSHRQIVNGKLADFSTAITLPHYATTPSLNPNFTPAAVDRLERITFHQSACDYGDFDQMLKRLNEGFRNKCPGQPQKGLVKGFAYPNGRGHILRYILRKRTSRNNEYEHRHCIYTLADPRTWSDRRYGPKGAPKAKWKLDWPSVKWLQHCEVRSGQREGQLKYWAFPQNAILQDWAYDWVYKDGYFTMDRNIRKTVPPGTYDTRFADD